MRGAGDSTPAGWPSDEAGGGSGKGGPPEGGDSTRKAQASEITPRRDYYFPGRRHDHAASSSGRFQSAASADSLKSAVSFGNPAGSSSRMVTRARREDASGTGSSRRTAPFGSMTASTVL